MDSLWSSVVHRRARQSCLGELQHVVVVVHQLGGLADGWEFLNTVLPAFNPLRGLTAAFLGELGCQLLVIGQLFLGSQRDFCDLLKGALSYALL